MENIETTEKSNASQSNVTDDVSLRSIIDTPLTDSLINAIFYLQNQDGSFPADQQLGNLFNVDFQRIQLALNEKGLNSSIADEIHRLISTASILFYFLYHSQKTRFPVDLTAIQQFISNARTELESFSAIDDPIMKTYIDKGESAVNYVISTREKYAHLCQELNLGEATWESYIQRSLGLHP